MEARRPSVTIELGGRAEIPLYGPVAQRSGLPTMTLRQELNGETIIPSRDEGGYLRLDARGFTAHPKHGSEKGRAWNEVAGFKPANVAPGVDGVPGPPLYQIGFSLREPPKKGRVGRWFVRRFYGVDDTLPGVYPDADEVVALMERWRQRYSTD